MRTLTPLTERRAYERKVFGEVVVVAAARLNPMAKRCARSGRPYIADYIPRVLQYMHIYTVLCSTTGTVYIYIYIQWL